MKKGILYIALAISVITNIVILCIFLSGSKNNNKTKETESPNNRQEIAEALMRKYVCENLYYPDSYDPVSTTVDSVFYGYITDANCINAAIKLIDLRASYDAAKSRYDENDWRIRFHGNPGGAFLEHERNARAEAKKEMTEILPKIEKQQSIIKNRDTSKDGEFFGWQVVHRYRANTRGGSVSFGDVLYVMNPEMTQFYYRFSLEDTDEKNLKTLRETIEKELGFYSDE